MPRIPLTRGMSALVDESDFERVLHHASWCAQPDGCTTYARANMLGSDGRRHALLMHTFITGWSYIDHINGNGLDNRRANLRQATHALNMANKRPYRNSPTGFKGVQRNTKGPKPWAAWIKVNGRTRRLGSHDTPEEAARAYDVAALEAWGPFARLNLPEATS